MAALVYHKIPHFLSQTLFVNEMSCLFFSHSSFPILRRKWFSSGSEVIHYFCSSLGREGTQHTQPWNSFRQRENQIKYSKCQQISIQVTQLTSRLLTKL